MHSSLNPSLVYCTATAIPFIYSIPFLGIARPQPQFPHSCVFERFIYSQDQSTYLLQQNWQTHRGNTYIIRSQTQNVEIGWDWGPDIPFLGIFVSNFRHFVFAVCTMYIVQRTCNMHSAPHKKLSILHHALFTILDIFYCTVHSTYHPSLSLLYHAFFILS
jgi:hypothetical protein